MSSILNHKLKCNIDGLVIKDKVGIWNESNLCTTSLGGLWAGVALLEQEVSTFELLALAGKEDITLKLLLDRLGEFDGLLLLEFCEGEFVNNGFPFGHRLQTSDALILDIDIGIAPVSVVEGFAHNLAVHADLGGEAEGLLGERCHMLEVLDGDVHGFIG